MISFECALCFSAPASWSMLAVAFFGTVTVKLFPLTLLSWSLSGTIIPILILTISLRSSCCLPLPFPLLGFFLKKRGPLFLFRFFKFFKRQILLPAGFISHLYFFVICKILPAFRTKFERNLQRLSKRGTKQGVGGSALYSTHQNHIDRARGTEIEFWTHCDMLYQRKMPTMSLGDTPFFCFELNYFGEVAFSPTRVNITSISVFWQILYMKF